VVLAQRPALARGLVGRAAAIAAGAAIAAALAAGAPIEWVLRGLVHARPAAMRGVVVEVAGRHVIVDCYNANPASTRAAVRLLAESKTKGRRIAVLGDMLELGPTTAQLHAEVGTYVAEQRIDTLIASGVLARNLAKGARISGMSAVHEAADAPAAAAELLALVAPGDVVLVKGSRGMRLERVVEALRTRQRA